MTEDGGRETVNEKWGNGSWVMGPTPVASGVLRDLPSEPRGSEATDGGRMPPRLANTKRKCRDEDI